MIANNLIPDRTNLVPDRMNLTPNRMNLTPNRMNLTPQMDRCRLNYQKQAFPVAQNHLGLYPTGY